VEARAARLAGIGKLDASMMMINIFAVKFLITIVINV
jgi:hypothetical protein